MTATIHDFCEYRRAQRSKARHVQGTTAALLAAFRPVTFQSMGEVLDHGFDDDETASVYSDLDRRWRESFEESLR